MNTLYLCSSNVKDRNETHSVIKKWGRKVAQYEVWAESEEHAHEVAKQIRETEFPVSQYDHSVFSCEMQEGVTIEGNKKSYQEIGKIYEVLPNGQAIVHNLEASL